jgi:DNA (cytosine-5)-methyltransferase 1
MDTNRMLRFIDLFAGTGGMRLALEQAALSFGLDTECVFSSEIDKKACQSYELNFLENPYSDIKQIDETALPDFELLLAGFPCQPFSYAGKQEGFCDKRGTLFFDIERILKHKKPRLFCLENVRGLITHDKGRTLSAILNSLQNLGYDVQYLLLNSTNFNVPQNRVRLFILGVYNQPLKITLCSDLGLPDTHGYSAKTRQTSLFTDNSQPKTVNAILEDVVDVKYTCQTEFVDKLRRVVGSDFSKLNGYRLIDYRGGKSLHSWELGLKGYCSEREILFMNLLISNRRKKIFGVDKDGKKLTQAQIISFYPWDDFEEVTQSLVSKGYLSLVNGEYNPVCGNMSFEVFKFLDPDGVAITLTASDANRLGIVQNNIPRRLTPRECARLQGFPDTYKLLADDAAVYKQLGNAVTVPVVKEVLLDLLTHNYTTSRLHYCHPTLQQLAV